MDHQIVFIIFEYLCSFLFALVTTVAAAAELNCWMGYSLVGPPYGDADEFGPLSVMNCTGQSFKCISTNCILDKHPIGDGVGIAFRYHSCSRDPTVWCRAHKVHCERLFNGTAAECAHCADNLCNAENYRSGTTLGTIISDQLVAGTAIGILFFFGTLFYCLLKHRKTWQQIHTV